MKSFITIGLILLSSLSQAKVQNCISLAAAQEIAKVNLSLSEFANAPRDSHEYYHYRNLLALTDNLTYYTRKDKGLYVSESYSDWQTYVIEVHCDGRFNDYTYEEYE